MNRIARAAAVAGIVAGASTLTAPAAMADINFFVVEKANVGHNGPVYIIEEGPGDLAYSNITGSPKASPKVGNKAVKTGDLKTSLKGGKGNTVVNEIEGSEQDQVAPSTHGEKGAQAEGAEAQGAEAQGPEAKGAEAQGAEAQGAQAEGAEAQGAEADAQGGEGQASGERRATKPHGDHKAKSKTTYAVKHANVGQNGPALISEDGPGNVAYSNVTGSPHAKPAVGNEAVKTGDIHTSLKGGKGNSVVNEVEGPEQDSGEQG